jgi:fructosamine-3-kinase
MKTVRDLAVAWLLAVFFNALLRKCAATKAITPFRSKATMWDIIEQQIQSVTGQPFRISDCRGVGGGCINQAFCIRDARQAYFVKLNQASKSTLFETEALALQELTDARSIRVPHPVCWGTESAQSYIVLEWIEFGRAPHWTKMGQQLAMLHRTASQQGFGWGHDNVIGETPQPNPRIQNWAEFFAKYRIKHQLTLAARRGRSFAQADALLDQIFQVLAAHRPQSSLVHGDLWSGNAGFDSAGTPVIFDPASYYGDREVDLAMTELFGGFPQEFYQAYQAAWPLDSGYRRRKVIYNLYHVLNHFNLFGGSYASQAEQMMNQIIAA